MRCPHLFFPRSRLDLTFSFLIILSLTSFPQIFPHQHFQSVLVLRDTVFLPQDFCIQKPRELCCQFSLFIEVCAQVSSLKPSLSILIILELPFFSSPILPLLFIYFISLCIIYQDLTYRYFLYTYAYRVSLTTRVKTMKHSFSILFIVVVPAFSMVCKTK